MNTSSNVSDFQEDFRSFRQSLSWIIAVTSAAALASNLLVVYLLISHRNLRTSGNILVASLASADIVFSLSVLVSQLSPRKDLLATSSLLCVVINTLIPWSSIASPWSLLAITVDRFLLVKYPLDYNKFLQQRSVLAIISTIWIGSLLYTLMSFIPWTQGYRTKQLCGDIITKTLPYAIIHFLFVALPCLIVGFLYCSILHSARETRRYHYELSILGQPRNQADSLTSLADPNNSTLGSVTSLRQRSVEDNIEQGSNRSLKQSYISLRKLRRITKTTRMFFYLTIFFFLFWLPLDIMSGVMFLCDDCRRNPIVLYLLWISITLYCLTPMVNPWVYTLRNRDFRSALRKFLGCAKAPYLITETQEVVQTRSAMITTECVH